MRVFSRIWQPQSCLSQNLIRPCHLEEEEGSSRRGVVSGRGNEAHGWPRTCESRRRESLTWGSPLASRAGVQQTVLDSALGVSQLRGHVVCTVPVPDVLKASMPELVLRHHYYDTVNTFWTRGFAFSFCTGSHKFCRLSCLGVESSLD